MPGPVCSVCELDASSVGKLETIYAMTLDKNGNTIKVSKLACEWCKEHHLEVHDENASE